MDARLATAISLTVGSVVVLGAVWALRPAAPPPATASSGGSATTAILRSGPAIPEPSAATIGAVSVPPPAVGQLRLAPRFDVVRVERDGSAVIAGRAEPGATVTLRVDGQPFADIIADANGQFVMTPPPLASGERALSLFSRLKDGDVTQSAQVVTILGAAQDNRVVALAEPGAPTRILGEPAPTPTSQTSIRSVEAEQGGAFYASGQAPAGADMRLYLNGGLVAQTTAGANGAWSVRIEKGMKAGAYQVRADQIGAAGKVASRAQVTFNYPAQAQAQTAAPSSSAPTPPLAAPALTVEAQAAPDAAPSGTARPAGTTVAQVRTHEVIRGDSLWRMSAKLYGDGLRYTEIYAANAQQIRNPDLIYPGQIFVAPQKE